MTPGLGRGAAALAIAGLLVGCDSPEATRVRGGGPGADIGNRGKGVLMHEGSRPYWRTPSIIPPGGQSDLDPALQAHRLSQAP